LGTQSCNLDICNDKLGRHSLIGLKGLLGDLGITLELSLLLSSKIAKISSSEMLTSEAVSSLEPGSSRPASSPSRAMVQKPLERLVLDRLLRLGIVAMQQSPAGPPTSFFPPFLMTTSSSLELKEEEEEDESSSRRCSWTFAMKARSRCLVSLWKLLANFLKFLT